MVYPRVGGGTISQINLPQAEQGLSPRGRGNRLVAVGLVTESWSIPAWAGEPALSGASLHHDRVYPRVGGGTLVRSHPGHGGIGLSPRGRGNPVHVLTSSEGNGSIPAWAGEPTFLNASENDE